MRRASARIRVEDWDKDGVTAPEPVPTEEDFISLSESGMRVQGGFAQPINAIFPDKHMYSRLRFQAAPVGAGVTSVGDVTVTLWELTPDREVIPAAAPVTLRANDTFPDIEIDNHDARYAFTVSAIADGAATIGVWVQGVYAPTYVAADGT